MESWKNRTKLREKEGKREAGEEAGLEIRRKGIGGRMELRLRCLGAYSVPTHPSVPVLPRVMIIMETANVMAMRITLCLMAGRNKRKRMKSK